jgi:cobalt-zinc-cadmium efflux system membrane fusion protein
MSVSALRRLRFRALAQAAMPIATALAALACERGLVPTAGAAPAGSASANASASAPRRVKIEPALEQRLGIRVAKAGDPASLSALGVPGTIEYDPDAYAEVGPRLDGRVVALHARLGDRVVNGDVLAELVVPTLGEAQAAVLSAEASLLAARKNAEREHDLLTRQLTTAREVELADTELARAKAEHAAATTRLRAVGGADARAARGNLPLITPIDGVVVQRSTSLGAFLASSDSAFVIADTGRLVVALDVHEGDLPYLAIGAVVTFRAEAVPDRTFTGTLARLDPVIGKTSRTLRARITAPNPDGALRPGMFVRAWIALAERTTAGLLLPVDAVQPLGADDVAFVAAGAGVYELRVLQIARRTPEVVEVTAGVSRGESIVIEGAFLLRAEATKQ